MGLGTKGIIALVVVLLLVVIFFSKIAGFLIDYQWFAELNYTEVFFKKLFTQIKFFVPSLVILFIVFYFYLRSINGHSVKNSGIILTDGEKRLRNRLFLLISLIASVFLSIVFVSQIWYDFLIYMNKTAFGLADPIFGKDIGFYIFSLPFMNKLYGFLMGLIVVFAIIAVAYNMITFATTRAPEFDEDANVRPMNIPANVYKKILMAASRQLTFLGGLFFLLLAFGYYLRVFELLYSARGVVYGARYTDMHVTLPSYYVYIGICLLTALLLMISWRRSSLKLAAFGPLLLVVAMVVSGVISAAVQNMIVVPNEIVKEEPYIQNNINYTNYAYALDKVTAKPFAVTQNLTRKDIDENMVTINNIPINDYRPAKDIYNQIQGLKNYYMFNDIDIDRYDINGTYRQVFISARELQSANVPGGQTSSWINRYLKYTHGYGIAMSPVNEVTPSGQPSLFIRDMPVVSDINIKVDRPQIYFGEMLKDFAVVNTREKEFDYPASNENVENVYEGTGGIKLNWLNRLMFAVTEGKLNFLLSQDISSGSRVLINREIMSRVQKIAPFLLYEDDPYIVTSDGKLYWVIDAYTVSSRYPYSEPINQNTTVNYIRNSVKIIIDAYNGTTDFYIADDKDPVIKTYSNIFKTLFKPISQMPSDLRAHMRYPQTLFDSQAEIYRKYHMKDARDFYNKSDMWDIGTQIYDTTGMQNQGQGQGQSQPVESSYLIMKLPGSDKEEFLLMSPYTPQGKNNMVAWLGVKNDGDDYGQIILYAFPSGKIVEGPMQVEGIISQDTIIGPQLNLLATGGNSKVERGNMLSIPINDSLLYVEPVYVRAINANALPELKKVIVFYDNKVVMEDTLDKALEKIFPGEKGNQPQKPSAPTTPQVPPAGAAGLQQLITQANTIFLEAQNAQKAGNWAEYGDKLTELEGILKELANASGQNVQSGQGSSTPAPTVTPTP